MTPRQISAFLILAERRIKFEKAHDLNLNAIASRANDKALREVTNSLLGRRR